MRTWARLVAVGTAVLAMAPSSAWGEETAASAAPARRVAKTRPVSLVVPASAVVYTTGAMGGSSGGGGGAGRKGPLSELAIAGLITLGAGYVGTVLGGQIMSLTFTDLDVRVGAQTTVDKLWVPVLGPFDAFDYTVNSVRPSCELELGCDPALADAAAVGIMIGGVAQVTGVVLFVFGLTTGGRSSDAAPTRSRVIMTSGALPGGGMLHVGGQF